MDREIPIKERMLKKMRLVPVILILSVFLILGQIWIRSYLQDAIVRESDILTAKVQRGRMEGSFSADAVVTPISTYRVEAMTGGRIEAIYYQSGDYVKKGQTILKLSNDDLKLNLLAQETAVTDQVNNLNNARILNNQSLQSQKLKIAEARNALAREQRKFRQKVELKRKSFISEEEYLLAQEDYQIANTRYEYLVEEARTDSLYRVQQLEQLDGAVKQLQLSLQQIRNRINELDVKAPMSGQITEIDLKLGQIISTGSLLAVIEDDTRYYLRGSVDQYYLGRLAEGAVARIRHQGEDVMLTVSKVYPRLINDKIQVDISGDIPKTMKSGQSVAVEVITDSLEDVLYLPQGQYLSDGGGHWVYVMDSKATRATRCAVRMGFRNIRDVEVLEGLKEGEVVITSSYRAYKDRENIRIKKGK
ncbi:MAG: HlyD family efflux transporter periplasmic adaptor subunit [Candidatus Cloacimonetes bacterium]|nr:HlyD family efflux transporter periplasmic adaptor subunit [Candidatus Cloacimonadota bacterium]MDY0299191.1 HlyD family efflux transporter periplasmic adaptor subunit [Candidatus Cloacimonadaceae bacterium]MCB5278265.1 HlyD family efflux transporter periplasmic adaptor subunit [Candidatus Cloacimonadota bacterium]MCK9332480.1 HlyD family efflux transporter periplasmic adaptor subunit [Candidatus Cloacimonadota bacterium]MDD2211178.1 HlyD family efflux transporter periplasmic adaptor subunit